VRELENVVERAALLGKGKFIGLEDLPECVQKGRSECDYSTDSRSLKEALAIHEAHLIRRALKNNRWNRQQTAAALGINRTTLFKKMRHYGLYAEAERLGVV
jgi:two-component system response regulator AtoC